ncbi:MAG: molybdate ABC transporter substrate-binding protein [Acidobacteria bacterium]|nr:molybdate ABC transporter substrate-binding protein [Acidobacteriota bacterium]
MRPPSLTSGLKVTLGLVAVLVGAGCATSEESVRVAAASDLQFALTEIADQFAADTGGHVDLIFGSSGNMTRQIRDGAPFSIFFSADESFVQQLVREGHTKGDGALYGIGRIVLFAPPGSPMAPDEGLDGLARLIQAGGVSRFAIANPEHAPYGRAAEQALRAHGIWDGIRPSLVLGENVSQAAQFATSGNTAGGIIAYSLALAPVMQDLGAYALIPAEHHAPLRQRMVLLKTSGPVAERFYQYVQSSVSRTILTRYGFVLPD